GVALDAGARPSGRKRARDPRVTVAPVDPEDVGVVHAELGCRDCVDTVVLPDMGEQSVGNGLVVHPRTETLEICERFAVALPGFLGVTPNDLLEAAVLGHGQASS